MWVNISIPCILWVFLFLFSLFCRIGVDGQFIRQSCFNIIDSILQLFWPPSLVQECIGPKKALDPPNKRGWMTLFWNRVLLDLQSPPVTWDRMILRVSTGWSGVVVKWLSAKERWPQWDMQIPPQILPLKLLKTPRFACCFFRLGNLNLRQNRCPNASARGFTGLPTTRTSYILPM